MLYIIILGPVVLILLTIAIISLIKHNKRKKNIILLSKLDVATIVNQQKQLVTSADDKNTLSFKLIQAGITQKEYTESRFVFALIGLILAIALPILFSKVIGAIGIAVGIACIIFGGQMYLIIAKDERNEKINQDLGTFLDLVNVILEAGGSLKNAFVTVSTKANTIINEELIKEISILEYEMTNYSTKQAYQNLKERVDSDEMGKIVDFLILSEETGIGVKNIFMTQSEEMRQDKFYKVKGKVSTLNMYLILVIFVFVLPAVGAFIIFPVKAGVLQMGL